SQLTRITRLYVARDGVVRAPHQRGCVAIRSCQIVGCQDLHNRLDRLHSRSPRLLCCAQWTDGAPRTGSTWSCQATPLWADFVTASGQVCWPSAGSFVAAYGQDLMSADNMRHCVFATKLRRSEQVQRVFWMMWPMQVAFGNNVRHESRESEICAGPGHSE